MKGSGPILTDVQCARTDKELPKIDKDKTQKILSELIFETHLDSQYDTIPLVFNDNDSVSMFDFKRKIAAGSFGTVSLYMHDNYAMAVKTVNIVERVDKADAAKKISVSLIHALKKDVEVIKLLGDDCDKVRSYAFELNVIDIDGVQKKIPIIVMENMDGSLTVFKKIYFDVLTDPNEKLFVIFLILYDLTNTFECLHKSKLHFTDVKLDNILFKCLGDKIITLIGDLGGAALKTESITYTFPSILRANGDFSNPVVYDMIYGLFIIYIELSYTGYKVINDLTGYRNIKDQSGKITQRISISIDDRLAIIKRFFDEQKLKFQQVTALLEELETTMIITDESNSLLDDPKLFGLIRINLKKLMDAIHAVLPAPQKAKYTVPTLSTEDAALVAAART